MEWTRNSSFFKEADDYITVEQEADDDDDVTTVPLDVPSRPYTLQSSRRAIEYLKIKFSSD